MKRPIKVVQFGEGNFLRGFVDWMMDILNEETEFNSDVQIEQPLSSGHGKRINKQQGLYHTLLMGIYKGKEVYETRLITCVRELVDPFQDYQRFLSLAHNEELRFIISNTTEAGIEFDIHDSDPSRLPLTYPGKS